MASLTKATRSFLGNRHKESSISTLHLKIYLINTFLREVGPLIGAATDSGLLKDLDLTILDEVDALDRSEEDMLQRAQEIDAFFIAYPSVLHFLTKLSLYNVRIDKLDTHHLLFECCKQLKHLCLSRCDTGAHPPFKIDAPNSELRVLELAKSRFERLELVCLPKLEKLGWNIWESHEAPLAFEFVPSLGELEFICDAMCGQPEFKLSELLRGTTCVHTLTLDFKGENLWIQPEMKQLLPAFNKLRKLSVRGIFVEFYLEWTIAFLVAAPCIEMLHIEVWEHTCDLDEKIRRWYPKRRTPRWEMHFDGSKNSLLKELEFIGFRSLRHQFTFIRSILERAPNMQRIVLKGDEQCEYCDALDTPPCPSKFPKDEEQEIVVKRIRDGIFSTQIFFDE
uniref:At1g61320/AtMIF1 LRR domain-containing protein n=1 Tax=Aegilops tauschii TaxID=37682 RepID=M8C4T3_AEGTA